MRTLLISKDGEVTLGDMLPEPLPNQFVRLGAFSPTVTAIGIGFDAMPVNVDTFLFRGYVALKDGRNILAIYEQS